MSKFNTGRVKATVSSPIVSEQAASGRTALGAPGFKRDVKGELFLLAVSNMVGENTFHEQADARDDRFSALVVEAAREDPEWVARFLLWLRTEGNMRSAPVVAAAELVRAKPEGLRVRAVVASVLQRADEPAEILAYWLSKYGRPIPIALKRGIADAVVRLYTERSLVKYDSVEKSVRFGDVIDMTQPAYHRPEIRGTWRYDLLGHALDRRHGRDKPIPESLSMLRARAELLAIPVSGRREVLAEPERLRAAGITWEALAGWLEGPMDAKAWEAVIDSMGIFALVRNLRNFDDAGVSDEAAARVAEKICDPEQVAKSRMFPFRFYAAYKHAPSLRWAHALDKALGLSMANVPSLKGRTLVLVDQSPSMFPGYYFSTANKSDITLADQAKIFGSAVALRAENADLVQYGGTSKRVEFRSSESLLRLVERFEMIDATDTAGALHRHYASHDRVLVVTDEQTRQHYGADVASAAGVPDHVPVYTWNMGGYERGHASSGQGQRHTFGGLSDAAFRLVSMIEDGKNAAWPF